MPRAPNGTLLLLLIVDSTMAVATYAALSINSHGWMDNLKTFALCSAIGILTTMSVNQTTKKKEENKKMLFGRKEKENAANWEERVKPVELVVEAEERPDVKSTQKDMSPKKIFEMVKALAESAQFEDEETWKEVRDKSERAIGVMANLESALQAALDASKEARLVLEDLSACVGEHDGA